MNETLKKPWLGDVSHTLGVLNRYGIHLQKRYGQNFLVDPGILEKIVRVSGAGSEDLVIEIGPGIGTMTQYLACQCRQVCAVEIDSRLIPVLDHTMSDWDNVRILNQDILKTDIQALVQEMNGGRPAVVVANLPYYITTPIIMSLLEGHAPLRSMTVMIQKEVADRMQAGPGSKDYGALSLTVQYYTHACIVAEVPAGCFLPRPQVDSAVIRLDLHEHPPVHPADEKKMFRLIRAAFNHRRKTMVNALTGAPDLQCTREQVEKALEKIGLDIKIRGERLSLEDFSALSDLL